MVRKLIVTGVIAATLAAPTLVRAHEGHADKLMGTVSSVDGKHISVKTTDGKTVMIVVDAKTKITQGKTKLTAAALKVGDRIVAEGAMEKEMLTATSLQVGTQPPARVKN
jgi:hypothetical protein